MEPDLTFAFEADIWIYPGNAPWHFITIPPEEGGTIRFVSGRKPGFGSVPVDVVVGNSRWKTSIFPDKNSGSYLLPIKADIRKKERLVGGDRVTVSLTINP